MVWGNLPSRIEQMARFRGSDYKWKGDSTTHALPSTIYKRPGPSAEQRGGVAAPARRVDDALACGREHSILGGAAYRSRARKPLWPCVGAALAPVSGETCVHVV